MSESEFVIKLNEEVSVSGQITAEMVEQVKALGFASVICNRPDGEGPDQPTAAEIEAALQTNGVARMQMLGNAWKFVRANTAQIWASKFVTQLQKSLSSGKRMYS